MTLPYVPSRPNTARNGRKPPLWSRFTGPKAGLKLRSRVQPLPDQRRITRFWPSLQKSRTLIALGTLLLVGLDGALVTDVVNGPFVDENQRYEVQVLELFQGPLYLVLAGTVGVLLGSWTRHVYAAVFGALMLFLPPVALLPWFVFDEAIGHGFLGAIEANADVGGSAPIAWQLLGLAAVAGAAAAAALARHNRRLVVVAIAAFSVSVLILGLPAGPEAMPLPGQPPPMTP